MNPAAGGGRGAALADTVGRALRARSVNAHSERARDLEHARELALSAARAGEVVVVVGGDGMIGAVADVLRTVDGALLGIVPAGRGNDLARVLSIPADPERACEVIACGRPRPIDLGEIGGRAFVGIASVGFDSEANRIANLAPARLGQGVYLYGALRALLSWRPARFELELDGPGERDPGRRDPGRRSVSGYTVAVANSKAYGGGMLLAPGARLDDGLLDVVTIGRMPKLRFLANLPRVFRGTHVALDLVTLERAGEVEIACDRPFTVYADGDPIARLPARVRAIPRALEVLVPRDGPRGDGP